MKEISKVSALAVGIVLCGVGMSSDASAAGYYVTPEQDAKIQQEGIEFNRRYDMEHGYYVANAVPAPVRYNVTAPVRRPRPAQVQKHAHQIYQQEAPARKPVSQPAVARQQAKPQNQNWQAPSARIAQAQQQEMARQEAARQQALARRQARQQATAQRNVNNNIAVGQQRALVNPKWANDNSWKTAAEKDDRMQQAALDYNRRYDMRYVK